MKNLFKFIIISILILILSNCKKYDEGPILSFQKPSIMGSWNVNRYYINDNDSTQEYSERYTSYLSFKEVGEEKTPEYKIIYQMDNKYDSTDYWFGSWLLLQKRKILVLERYYPYSDDNLSYFPFDSEEIVIFEIKKFTKFQLIIESTINGLDFRIELVKRSH